MEVIAKVINVNPMTSRTYTDEKGQEQTIISKGFVLQTPHDKFYAEAIGEHAVKLDKQEFYTDSLYACSVSINCKPAKTQNGETFMRNNLVLRSINKFN